MRTLARLAVAAALVLAPAIAWSDDTKSKDTLCWKVTRDGAEVHLLGSIHLATEDLYPLQKEVEDAYDRSKHLVVEADIGKGAGEVQAMVMEKGMLPEGDSLSKHVSKETLELLEKQAEKYGIPMEALDRVRPWLIALQLQAMAMQKLGLDGSFGIDKHFLDQAAATKKPVLELEGVEAQLSMLAGFSDDLQEKFLKSTVADNKAMRTQLKDMLAAYKAGDAKKLEEITFGGLTKEPDLKPFFEKMFDERNVKMVEKVDGYLKTKEPHFVVVGAGHLLGPKGILKLLEDKGCKVVAVKGSGPSAKRKADAPKESPKGEPKAAPKDE